MPERNLVSVQNVLISIVICGLVSLTGCSKLGNSAYQYDRLVDRTNDLGWDINVDGLEDRNAITERTKELESAASYIADTAAAKENDVARIVAVAKDSVSIESEPIKLVARQTFVETNAEVASEQTEAPADPDCAHGTECDCHKKRVPLKLAHVEPMEPPSSFIPATMSPPPMGVVSQPLSPLAPIESSPTEEAQARYSPNDSNDNLLRTFEVNVSGTEENTTGFKLPAIPADVKMPCCGEATCGPDCSRLMELRPSVASEPVVIVATVSPEEIPPFAEAPAEEEAFFVPEPELEVVVEQVAEQFVETKLPEFVEVAIVEAEAQIQAPSNLSDEEWFELFAVNSAANSGNNCPGCQSPECDSAECASKICANGGCSSADCQDKSCGSAANQVVEKVEIVVNEISPEMGGSFLPPTVAATDFQAPQNSNVVSSNMTVEVTQDANDQNQFAPASFTSDVLKPKYEIVSPELKDWKLPLPANSFVASEPESSDVSEGDLTAANVEVARAPETSVSEPEIVIDSAPLTITPEAQVRDRPEVKVIHQVEVIDNTIPWDVQLEQTIAKVRSDMQSEMDPSNRNGLEVNLRLLQVLQRQMHSVEEHRQVLTNEEKSYWQHQLEAINLMLDSRNSDQSDFARHNAALQTLAHLRKAVEGLEAIANLQLSNPTFCREVTGFGQFTPFQNTQFRTDQKMLVYCEVENFKSREGKSNFETRYHTSLRGSYAIYDQEGSVVQQAEYPIVEDVVRKRRRDFYMYFPVQLKQLPVGSYRMELLVEDLGGNKTATMPAMDFHVR